jgi:hypothetical protein
MKHTLLSIIQSDSSYNKSSTRYLYRTHPALWVDILQITSFLPVDAKPKQRVWHIINEVWEIPKCPVTGDLLKWNEKAYFETSSKTARMKIQHDRGDFKYGHLPEINEKRQKSNIAKVKSGRKYRDKSTYTLEMKEKIKSTFLKNYGVDNPSKHQDIRKKISDAHIANGCAPKDLRSLRRLYYDEVDRITKQNWNNYFDKINPSRLNRSENALDHIYSKHQGFKECIPPWIIGHWTNLRVISLSENSGKGSRCGKTADQLFADYYGNR